MEKNNKNAINVAQQLSLLDFKIKKAKSKF